jgi:ABC-type antimicrobial peptide transport system permease subunit
MTTRLNVGYAETVETRQAEIAGSYPGAWTLTPATPQDTVRHARTLYGNLMLLGGIPLLAISALCVVATMSGTLARNKARISLFKALGADEGSLVADYLQRALILGVVGTLLGLVAGWFLVDLLNGRAPSGGIELLFTPRLVAGIFLVSVLSAMTAAVGPTSHAVRQDAAATLYAFGQSELQSGGSVP